MIGKDDRSCKQPMIRNYANDAVFLLVFPDGTGNVLYPSKNYLSVVSLSPVAAVVSEEAEYTWS